MKVTLTVIEGPHTGAKFEFEQHDTFIVGRAPTALFRLLQDDFFSRNHFLIEVSPPLCRLLDLNSRNGTFVNGNRDRVTSVDLQNGDKIRGGKTTISVEFDRPLPPAAAETDPGVGVATLVPRGHVRPGSKPQPSHQPTVIRREDDRPPVEPPRANPPKIAKPDSPPVKKQTGPGSLPQFPGYRTIRVLGQGGMGIVYEADSLADRSRVAVKVVSPNVAANSEDLSRFIREASILRDLVHPHIVRYRDLGQKEGALFIVMDYIDGVTVESLLAESAEPLSVPRAIGLMQQLLDALAYAHQRGYIHRDVKPSNLMIASRDGVDRLSLTDFGLAKTYQSSKLSGLTMTGEIGGTAPFMPPEQITNYRKVEPAADQYSAAATLYYLLTKQHVYNFPREPAQQLLMILQDPPVRIELRRTGLPKRLADIIQKALSRSPGDRFPDVSSFQKELRKVGS